MMPLQLPWWLDFDHPPHHEPGAQPIWIFGQWQFIPFTSTGRPLRRMCGDLSQARQEVARFEGRVAAAERDTANHQRSGDGNAARRLLEEIQEFVSFCTMDEWSAGDPNCPKEYAVYGIGRRPEDLTCVILEPDGRLAHLPASNYGEAIDRALEPTGTIPTP